MTLRDRVAESLARQHLDLAHGKLNALCSYAELLVKWNRRVNLTGFTFDEDIDAAIERLLLEPLAAARIARSGRRLLDVGSGGGSPAIPFFLGLEDASELVLIESRFKKAVFLGEALRAAEIPGQVIHGRFEEVVLPGPFDLVTVRAVAVEGALWDLLRRALGAGGRIFWFHSGLQAQPKQDVVAWREPRRLLQGDSWVSVGLKGSAAPP